MRTEFPLDRTTAALVVAGMAALASVTACGKRNQYQPPPAPPVTVSKPLRMPVTDYLQSTGSVAAFKTVDLMARVEGYLRSVNFQDGSVVKAGQLLFVIEPEPYQAKLASYQAQLLDAQAEYDRQLRMIKENATSQANVDKWLSQRDQAAAAVTLAKINLGYTRVTAPFDGRIDRHLVDPGNLVGTAGTATKLATIEQINPAYVYFSINERDLLRVRAAVQSTAKAQGTPLGEAPRVPVQVALQTDEGYPYVGTLDFAGSGLDTGSGTLQLRASVPNAKYALLPGLFARLRVALAAPVPRLVVPDRVVSSDQVGSYLLTVGADQKVKQQRIEIGPLENGYRAVLAGLDANSEVVIDGLQNAIPGNVVTATERPLTAPAYQAASAQ
jgi:RND family efflux transporter MFP subunit